MGTQYSSRCPGRMHIWTALIGLSAFIFKNMKSCSRDVGKDMGKLDGRNEKSEIYMKVSENKRHKT